MITTRRIDKGDRAAWLSLWSQYLDFYGQAIQAEVTDQTWNRFFTDEGHKCLIAVDPAIEKAIGFTTYLIHPSTWTLHGYCYLEDLFVDPSATSRGAGRLLIEAVVAVANEMRISRVYWHTQSDNLVAQGLYDKVGKNSQMIQYRITAASS